MAPAISTLDSAEVLRDGETVRLPAPSFEWLVINLSHWLSRGLIHPLLERQGGSQPELTKEIVNMMKSVIEYNNFSRTQNRSDYIEYRTDNNIYIKNYYNNNYYEGTEFYYIEKILIGWL